MSMNKEKLKYDLSAYENAVVALAQAIEIGVVNSVNTCEVVRVLSVDEGNHTLTAIPVVKNLTTQDVAGEEAPIYNLKYFGWQFGNCAIQATPKKDDVGFIVVSKRDISNINSGVVGSKRKFNMADGIYVGGLVGFNSSPTEYIKFDDGGITIKSTKDINVESEKATIKAKKVDILGSEEVNLGAVGGLPIAKDGDVVMAGDIVIGNVKASGTIVKSI